MSLIGAWLVCLCLSGGFIGSQAYAQALRLNAGELCHAVQHEKVGHSTFPSHFQCAGTPQGYQSGTLWLRAKVNPTLWPKHDPVVVVGMTRFDRLDVTFMFADGATHTQNVLSQNYGTHWRVGTGIIFEVPPHPAPLTSVYFRFDRLFSIDLLRLRVMAHAQDQIRSVGLAAAVGAALMLLFVGGLYNASFAVVTRRVDAAWQAAWAFVIMVWGLCWSQLILLFMPHMAGVPSGQVCTALAFLTVCLTVVSIVQAIDKRDLDPKLRKAAYAIAVTVAAAGVPMTFARSGSYALLLLICNILNVVVLLLILACLFQACRRGSSEAKIFVGAWIIPLTAFALTTFTPHRDMFWGNGPELMVLFAAAWQTLWLAAFASRGYVKISHQRDLALQAESQAKDQARRDPLTGLPNRRALFEVAEAKLAEARRQPIGLLLIDVDHFKSINDNFGHRAGDAVLIAIAQHLARYQSETCSVARVGGEEFAIFVTGLDAYGLRSFGNTVCRSIAACDHSAIVKSRRVTVSIGIAKLSRDCAYAEDEIAEVMDELYQKADFALYAAKREGRNQVVMSAELVRARQQVSIVSKVGELTIAG